MNKFTKLCSKEIILTTVCSALIACGGSGGGDASLETPAKLSDNLAGVEPTATVADDASVIGVESVSLAGSANSSSSIDMFISNAKIVVGSTSSQSIAYRFDVTDTSGADLPLDKLSVALEVAASGSFADSYRIALFDIRSENSDQSDAAVTFSARSSVTDLPSGNYAARLVVNPNWQNAFDTLPPAHDDRLPFRYVEEFDYSNNASNVFQIDVTNTKTCAEDSFEDDDSFSAATVIPAGGLIDASLCLDDVDFYSVDLTAGSSASLTFDYTDDEGGLKRATRYVVFDSNANRLADGIAREANDIVINADDAGIHYLALYGQRSSYRIVRADGPGLANDFSDDRIFGDDSIAGPKSWLFGQITLNKLAFTDVKLSDQVINCGRIITQFNNDEPVSYVTPQRFADIHTFRLLTDGSYLIDDELHAEWSLQNGDIVNSDWYENDYPGYAEIVDNNSWRYWSTDGLGYTECAIATSG